MNFGLKQIHCKWIEDPQEDFRIEIDPLRYEFRIETDPLLYELNFGLKQIHLR